MIRVTPLYQQLIDVLARQGRGRSIDFDEGVRATLKAFSWLDHEIAELFEDSLAREAADLAWKEAPRV